MNRCEPSHRGPLEDAPLGHRLLRRPFLLHSGPCCQAGTRGLQCSSSSSLITPLPKPLVPQGLASLPQRVYTPLQRFFSLRSAHLAQHHGGRYPYAPARQPGKPTPQGRQQPSPLRPGSADSPQGLFNAILRFRAICTRG